MADMTAASIYGTAPVFVPAVQPDTMHSATDSAQLKRGLKAALDPGNPLLWFAGILLVTVGAAGFAGSVKLGPAKIGAAVGKS